MSHFLLALVVLAAGVVVAVEAVSFERGRAESRLPRVIRRGALVAAAALLALVVTGTVSTAAGPHPGGSDVERLWRLHAAVYVHVRATAIFGLLFLAFLVYVIRGTASAGRFTRRVPACCSSCSSCRWASESCSTARIFRGGSSSSTSALAAAVWACAVALVAVIQRPPKPFAPTSSVDCLDGRRAEDRRTAEACDGRFSICAFRGWNDGGQGASLAGGFLARSWKAERFADIDPEEFFDFQVTRPHVSLVDGRHAPARLARDDVHARADPRARAGRRDPARHRAEHALAPLQRTRRRARRGRRRRARRDARLAARRRAAHAARRP